MPDMSDPSREAIHEAIQANVPVGQEAVLTGWVLVTEWMDHDGERWLSKGRAATTPVWAGNGMHHEALYGHWPSGDDE